MLFLYIIVTVGIWQASSTTLSVSDLIAAHNSARAEVSLGPVTWTTELETSAQISVAKCPTNHDPASPTIENLSWGWPTLTTAEAFKNWYDEKAAYLPTTQTCVEGKVCGHYKNIVQYDSVGCAMRTCSNLFGQAIVDTYACHYGMRSTAPATAAAPAATPAPTSTATPAVVTAAPASSAAPTSATPNTVAAARSSMAYNNNTVLPRAAMPMMPGAIGFWPGQALANASSEANRECTTSRDITGSVMVGAVQIPAKPALAPDADFRRAPLYPARTRTGTPTRYMRRPGRSSSLRQPWAKPDQVVVQ